MSSDSTDKIRAAVASCYLSKSWKWKAWHMPDHQVVAIYLKFKKEGKIQ